VTNSRLFALIVILTFNGVYAQEMKRNLVVGIYYGLGDNLGNKNYSYTSHYCKVQLSTLLKQSRNFKYQLIIQLEIDFIEYKCTNGDYYAKEYMQSKLEKPSKYGSVEYIKDYSLNVGFIISTPISERFSIFLLGSVGPMITDTESDRLSEGFAFSNIISLGIAYKVCNMIVEVRPNFSHLSNGGL
jgi:hypothetical protein